MVRRCLPSSHRFQDSASGDRRRQCRCDPDMVEAAAFDAVFPLEVEVIRELLLEFLVVDGAGNLDSPVEVAGEEVCGSDKIEGVAVVFENEDDVTSQGGELLGERLQEVLAQLFEKFIESKK